MTDITEEPRSVERLNYTEEGLNLIEGPFIDQETINPEFIIQEDQENTTITNQNNWTLMIPPIPNANLFNLVQAIIGDAINLDS